MSQKTTEDKITISRVRSIRRSGDSAVVTIPPTFLEVTKFKEGDDVELIADVGSDELTIRLVDE